MDFEVDGWNNFCRVFEMPKQYPNGFCSGGGHPVNFQMVDWFNPVPGISQPAVSKEVWREKVGEIEVKKVSLTELKNSLVPFLKDKQYIHPGRDYLVLCDFGASFQFNRSTIFNIITTY